MSRRVLIVILVLLAGLLAGCSGQAAKPTATVAPTQASASVTSAAASGDTLRLAFSDSGNEARYRVREQLAQLSLPSDAVGATSAVSGAIVINSDGTVVSGESKIVVDLAGLKSDKSMRDRYVQRNLLETSTYPSAEFVVTSASGLPSPLPTSGPVTFQLAGDLTVRGITRPTTWDVTATAVDGRELTGTATTTFTFADFNIPQPRVPVVLSVEDNITLELDFRLTRAE